MIVKPFFLCVLVGFTVICSAIGTQGSEAIVSSELAGVTGGPASGEGLHSALNYDEEIDEEVSGGDHENFHSHGKTTISFLFDNFKNSTSQNSDM